MEFDSPRLVKREVAFPTPRRALVGSNQLWRVNDSPYYREYDCCWTSDLVTRVTLLTSWQDCQNFSELRDNCFAHCCFVWHMRNNTRVFAIEINSLWTGIYLPTTLTLHIMVLFRKVNFLYRLSTFVHLWLSVEPEVVLLPEPPEKKYLPVWTICQNHCPEFGQIILCDLLEYFTRNFNHGHHNFMFT